MTSTTAPTESQALTQEGTSLEATAAALVVTDTPSFERAAEMLKTVKLYLRRVAEVFDPIVDAAHRAHKTAVTQRDSFKRHALLAEQTIKARLAAYEQEQERQRRAAEESARRERERLESEARARAEAEQRRLVAAEEERRLAEATAAEARGDTAAADKILEEPIHVPTVAPTPVFTPPVAVATAPKIEGVSYRDGWQFEIERPDLVPREFCVPDEKKIRGVVNAMGDKANIPGVRVIPKRIVAVRA